MAVVMVVIRVMPEGVDVDIKKLEKKVKEEVTNFGAEVTNTTTTPIAFGLNALDVEFFIDEKRGAMDPLEEKLTQIKGVASASTTSVRRVVG